MSDKSTLALIISAISVIAAAASSLFTWQQSNTMSMQRYAHIKPEIQIALDKYDKHDYLQPVVSIRNLSPINIRAVSLDYVLLYFDKEQKALFSAGTCLSDTQHSQRHTAFEKKIESNDFVSQELADVISLDSIASCGKIFIYIIFCTYYRESDMQRFDIQGVFFLDDGKIVNQSNIQPYSEYELILGSLNGVQPPNFSLSSGLSPELLTDKHKESPLAPAAPIGLRMVHTCK